MKNCHKKHSFRNLQIIAKFKSGLTLEEIGSAFGITRERVRQILKMLNINPLDGGRVIRSLINIEDKISKKIKVIRKKEQRIFSLYGLSIEEYEEILKIYGSRSSSRSPLTKWAAQKSNAKVRGIEFTITFKDWWDIWRESGKYEFRGVGKYVMGRYGDSGGYEKGNVFICTQSENSKDSYITSPHSERFKNNSRMGKGKGFIYHKECKAKPYQAQFRRRSLGYFETEKLAKDAYLKAIEEYKLSLNKESA